MLKFKGLVCAVVLAIAPFTFAQPIVDTHRIILKGQNGERTVVVTGPTGQVTGYQFNKNNLLTSKKWGNQEVHYTYNASNLLAYTIDKQGKTYTITRDRDQRIISIAGAKQLRVLYTDKSAIPTDITLTNLNGQTVKQQFIVTRDDTLDLSLQSLKKIDQKLITIIDVDCPEPNDCGGDGGDGSSGNNGGGDGGGNSSGSSGNDGGSGGNDNGSGAGSDGGDDGGCDSSGDSTSATHLSYIFRPNITKSISIKASGTCPVTPCTPLPCEETCDRAYSANIGYCQRILPGTSAANQRARALCYANMANIYAECLADC